ncbi:GerMN domain-containing protein [Bacillus sp. SCS-153A]|uniref:GerMN domain-containing protein n=1 Tax=Rossellomorea sedimentorum TaxID=3115294 RepID=UPI00390588BF
MSKKTKAAIVLTVLTSSVYLSGCGLLGGGEKAKIDPPSDVSYLEEGEKVDAAKENSEGEVTSSTSTEEAAESVMTELYLIDSNGFVVSQTMALPKTESIAKQALEYLVADGPVQNMLPNGFKAVLPAGTQVSVNIKEDGTAVADFSSEFQNYQPEDEKKILESVTWTLTQFDSVEKVELRVNGYELTEMPVNGTPVDQNGLTRKVGINIDTSGVTDLTDTHPVTVYFVSQKGEHTYYVPVTKRVSNKMDNKIEAVVHQLIQGPGHLKNLLSDFTGVALLDEPTLKDGQVTLNFNEGVYGSFEEKIVSEHFMNSLVLSLTEQENVKSVAIMVNGEGELFTEQGEPLSEPVTRPENVNTISF